MTAMLVVELVGMFVFGVSGGLVAVRMRLDIVGVGVLSTATGVGGGVVRDMLLDAGPPPATSHWYYVAAPLLGGGLTFFFHPAIRRIEPAVNVFDAFGLGLFTVSGSLKALELGFDPVAATGAGVVTGVGGGVIRDVLANQVPRVLARGELYAIPAIAGAALLVLGHALHMETATVGPIAFFVIVIWRLIAVRRGWNAPEPRRGRR